MPKAILSHKYAGKAAGTPVEGSEVEINGLVVLGLAFRVDDTPARVEVQEENALELPAIPLNPPPAMEAEEDHEEK